ncbi:MAG TPA: tail fiber protein [Allosphingosinicella sp.]|nr:tail fiber protein [Allosphingosinicella sp.]
MAQPYVGEIRMFAGTFYPAGWLFCDGQLLPISENEVLFQVIGTTYGGDGQENFALPNLQSRIPLHFGQGPGLAGTYPIGEMAGVESVTLTTQQIPQHTHPMLASTDPGLGTNPAGAVLGALSPVSIYKVNVTPPNQPMAPQSVLPQGGSQPHENMQPFLGINYIISLFGIFPSPN